MPAIEVRTTEIEVRTQDEFDAAIQRGDKAICVSGNFSMTAGRGQVDLLAGTRLDVSGSGCASVHAVDSATVRAWDSAIVQASGSATVHAWGSATVHAWERATVCAVDRATVHASDRATVHAGGRATVHASDSVIVRVFSPRAIVRPMAA